MIDPSAFLATFERRGMIKFPREVVSQLPFREQDARWLTDVGLPSGAAPFLSFGSDDDLRMPTLTEVYGVTPPRPYRIIGSNGSGDPVAIDTATDGEVVYLNHDADFARVFINSSISQLAHSLYAYAQLIADAQAVNGPDAYFDGKIPTEVRAHFVSVLEAIDPHALTDGMWAEELQQLDARSIA